MFYPSRTNKTFIFWTILANIYNFTLKFYNINSRTFKFIFDYSNLNIGPELSDYLEAGEIIIRPDKKIYGLASKGLDINKLVSELLMQIE